MQDIRTSYRRHKDGHREQPKRSHFYIHIYFIDNGEADSQTSLFSMVVEKKKELPGID